MTERAKHCKACNTSKPISAFSKMSSAPDGRQYTCKQCRKERANSAQVVARVARWREANPDRLQAQRTRYYEANIDEVKARSKRQKYEHRAHIKLIGTDIDAAFLRELRETVTCCPLCDAGFTYEDHVAPTYPNLDHIVPVAHGGPHTRDNVRLICRQCNVRRPRGVRALEEVA